MACIKEGTRAYRTIVCEALYNNNNNNNTTFLTYTTVETVKATAEFTGKAT